LPTPADKKSAPPAPRPRRGARVPLEVPPLTHPAMLLGVLVFFTCVILGPTFIMSDTDMWQHLAVGRAIWQTHSIPMTNVWTWPTYGEKIVLPSWLFRAILWPFWSIGGMLGLQVWRWLTNFVVFLFAWASARRLGARGFVALAMLAWAALVYRHRVYVRPETFAAVLIALTEWILLTRRAGGPNRAWWLVPLAWLWPNAHISFWVFFALTGIHAFAEFFDRTGKKPSLWFVLVLSVAASFANPWGWKALAEPFQYAFFWSKEPIFKTIGELMPVDWKFLATTGFVVVVFLWPLFTIWRALRGRGWDIAELLTMVFFMVLGVTSQRFVAVWAVVAAPYLARDAASIASDFRWPAFLRPVWVRLALMTAVVIGGSLPDWRRTDLPFGIGVETNSYPAGACEFMAKHGIRGHGFNHFEMGGYMLWRFWPEPDRLPFFDIHLTGKPEDRLLAGMMLSYPSAWQTLDAKYHFPFLLLRRLHGETDISLDIVEADSNFAMVFLDDAACIYVRKKGPLAAVADSFTFRLVRAGRAGMADMGRELSADSTLRPVMRAEMQRMIDDSPANANANSMLSQMDLVAGNLAAARGHLTAAHRVDPTIPLYYERLGMMLLREGNPQAAEHELETATHQAGGSPLGWMWLGEARARLGNRDGAIRAYRRSLQLDPGNAGARAGLDSLGVF